jgi:EAL domain-containing protein (putative c-di-GMP-specific phosphodiesterase class I)/ActR/RegA family two-component response regulator
MSVLIVDDNKSIASLLAALLRSEGLARVHTESDARRVPERMITLRPDLVLLDLHMPHVDGFETLERVQQHAAGSYLPVLVLTADITTQARDRALRQGAQDYLTKPFDADEAVLRIGNLLRTRQLYVELRPFAGSPPEITTEQTERTRRRVDAVLRDNSIHTVYQPVVDITDKAIVGYEALSRFADMAVRGPDHWFADAFAVDRGVELEWLAATTALDPPTVLSQDQFLAVNMSPATILHILDQPLCDPAASPNLVIELTEHVPVEDYSALHRALAPIRSQGARLAADDIGAGYAGFRHLLSLQPDIIKLDISLVGGIHHSPPQQALAKALTTFATDVGARIIAEGVEEPDELTVLQDLGVQWAQGFLLGKPQPPPTNAPIRPRSGADH